MLGLEFRIPVEQDIADLVVFDIIFFSDALEGMVDWLDEGFFLATVDLNGEWVLNILHECLDLTSSERELRHRVDKKHSVFVLEK